MDSKSVILALAALTFGLLFRLDDELRAALSPEIANITSGSTEIYCETSITPPDAIATLSFATTSSTTIYYNNMAYDNGDEQAITNTTPDGWHYGVQLNPTGMK